MVVESHFLVCVSFVVLHEGQQQVTKVPFSKHDDVVNALLSDRAE
jgi:hypothetical protein